MKSSAMKRMLVCWMLVAILGFGIGCASVSDVRYLDERLRAVESLNTDLKRDSQELLDRLKAAQKQQEAQESDLMTRYAGHGAAVNAVREEMSRLEGVIEELNHRDDLAADAVDRLSAVLDRMADRLAALEAFVGLEKVAGSSGKKPETVAAAVPAPTIPAPPPEPKTEAELYEAAKGLFDKGDMGPAREMFSAFLEKFPKSPNADNAQFWIGETYYRENWFEKAILEYQEVIESYPKGNKVPSALLKQALSFLKLGNRLNCQILLKDIIARFPDTHEAEIAGKKLAELQ